MQHLAAVMLIDGTVTFDSCHDAKRMKDPKVLEVRRRIHYAGDPELQKAYRAAVPNRQAIVNMTFGDGRKLRYYAKTVKGTTQNPMTREEVGDKSVGLLAPVLGHARASELIDTIWDIERVKNVRSLRRLLSDAPKSAPELHNMPFPNLRN